MKLIRTAKIKLNIKVEEILPTLEAYTKAFNFVCQIGFNKKISNGIELHKLTYQETRSDFFLPSQLACSARIKATEALKSTFTKMKHKKYGSCPKSKLCSVRLDKNSYSLFLSKSKVSILTISGRKQFKLDISEYHKEYFKSWKYKSADLCIKKNKVYLHISFEKGIEDLQPNKTLIGIDRGINNLAVVSNNQFYGGGIVKNQTNKYNRLRKLLQKKGTKSAKRHLKQLSGKEKRFRADVNHQISNQIINSLNPGDTIVLEDLTGIRNRRLRKPQRTLINNWSYFQLEQFLKYKADAKGIKVQYIDARYTSQRCSSCGFILRSNRKQHSFECKSCGFKLNADLNASRNICIKASESYKFSDGTVINQPIVSIERSGTNRQPCADSN